MGETRCSVSKDGNLQIASEGHGGGFQGLLMEDFQRGL